MKGKRAFRFFPILSFLSPRLGDNVRRIRKPVRAGSAGRKDLQDLNARGRGKHLVNYLSAPALLMFQVGLFIQLFFRIPPRCCLFFLFSRTFKKPSCFHGVSLYYLQSVSADKGGIRRVELGAGQERHVVCFYEEAIQG